ncbi:hypothetical protein PMAYCL1PPCAC_23964, partial [Pristionchus mayeri]
SEKFDFDVTPSGANDQSLSKMNMPIVISTPENPKIQSFDLRNQNGDATYEAVCLRIEQIRRVLAEPKNHDFFGVIEGAENAFSFGVIECAENHGLTHFAPRAFVGSRRRHVE